MLNCALCSDRLEDVYPIINLFLVLEFLRVMRDGVSMKKSRIFPVYFTSLTSIYIFVKSGQKVTETVPWDRLYM